MKDDKNGNTSLVTVLVFILLAAGLALVMTWSGIAPPSLPIASPATQ